MKWGTSVNVLHIPGRLMWGTVLARVSDPVEVPLPLKSDEELDDDDVEVQLRLLRRCELGGCCLFLKPDMTLFSAECREDVDAWATVDWEDEVMVSVGYEERVRSDFGRTFSCLWRSLIRVCTLAMSGWIMSNTSIKQSHFNTLTLHAQFTAVIIRNIYRAFIDMCDTEAKQIEKNGDKKLDNIYFWIF